MRIKVILTASFIAAVVFWGLSAAALWADPLQGHGRAAVIVAVAVVSDLTWLVLLLHLREKRTDDRLRREREELRKEREAVMRLAAAIVSRHGVPVQAARPLTVVQESLLTESA